MKETHTSSNKSEISDCQGQQIIVHSRMQFLALDDDQAHKEVAKDTSKEEEDIEDGHQHKDKMVLHLLRSKYALQTLGYFTLVQLSQVAEK